MGSPKVGKSMWLCNLCANSVRNGEDSIYITLEMAYQLVS
jgi:KaiC/GvpD/RAD55 family RecA-like ATPase